MKYTIYNTLGQPVSDELTFRELKDFVLTTDPLHSVWVEKYNKRVRVQELRPFFIENPDAENLNKF